MKFRLKYFIYPQFQSSLLLANILSNLIVFALIYSQIYSLFESLESTGHSINLPQGHIYFQFIEMQKSNIIWSTLMFVTLSILLTSILTLWFSHRLAGPLVRLKKHLSETIQLGQYHELNFRKGDYFSDLPEILNEAIKRIKKNESK
jgi:hypothetical protein